MGAREMSRETPPPPPGFTMIPPPPAGFSIVSGSDPLAAIKAAQAEKYPTAAEQGGKPGAVATPLDYQGFLGKLTQFSHVANNTAPEAATGMEPTGNTVLDIARGTLAGGIPGSLATEGMTLAQQIANSPLANIAKAARGLIPSSANASKGFETVASATNEVPIDTAKAQEIVARAKELGQRGNTVPKVIRDFAKATAPGDFMTQPVDATMTYQAGRDFASKAGALSAQETAAVKGTPMQRQVTQFAAAMKDANREAAVKVGMGDLYDQAMKEYRQAKNLQDAGDVLKKYGIRALLVAAAGAAGTAGYEAFQAARGK
jgi:hypothetical protein